MNNRRLNAINYCVRAIQGAEPSHDVCSTPFHYQGQSRFCCLGRPDVQSQVAASHLTYLGPLEAAKGLLPKEYRALVVQPTIQRQRPSGVGSHMRNLVLTRFEEGFHVLIKRIHLEFL